MRNPRNILRHELIGLQCEVISSKNASQAGIKGKIIDETLKTIVIGEGGKKKTVEKKGAVFRVRIDEKTVDIDGNYIASRPEDRIKKKISRW